MTRRAALFLVIGLLLWLLGLALGNPLYFFIAFFLFAILLYSLISVSAAYFTLRSSFFVAGDTVMRGEALSLAVQCGQKSPLPVSPLSVSYRFGDQTGALQMKSAFWTRGEQRVSLCARHVGQYKTGVTDVAVSDLFGLFRFIKKARLMDSVLVLPRPFHLDKPEFCVGDEGNAALSRTQEDYTSPEDVRSFRAGDAFKRVHWKLSIRKRELLVRKYETPAPPDTLILLDCSEPSDAGDPERLATTRDVLCETAVAAARIQMADQSPVRLPLYGERTNEFTSDNAGSLHLLQEMLAAQTFRRGEDFSRVLRLELRRMRRTGATIIITTRLDANVVDAVAAIRRMGPSARLYLVTHTPEDEKYRPFIARLQHHLVEVCYVTPQ